MKDANAAITLLEKWPEKIQALNGIPGAPGDGKMKDPGDEVGLLSRGFDSLVGRALHW